MMMMTMHDDASDADEEGFHKILKVKCSSFAGQISAQPNFKFSPCRLELFQLVNNAFVGFSTGTSQLVHTFETVQVLGGSSASVDFLFLNHRPSKKFGSPDLQSYCMFLVHVK